MLNTKPNERHTAPCTSKVHKLGSLKTLKFYSGRKTPTCHTRMIAEDKYRRNTRDQHSRGTRRTCRF